LAAPSNTRSSSSVHIAVNHLRDKPHTLLIHNWMSVYIFSILAAAPQRVARRGTGDEGGRRAAAMQQGTRHSIVAFKSLQSLHKSEEDYTMVCALDSLALLRRPAPRSISDAT
jgi:hypothetical protein